MVNPFPTNANIFVPGPALFFCVVDGIPSLGKFIQVGDLSGKPLPAEVTIGRQLQTLATPVNNSNFDASPDESALESFGVGKLVGIVAAGVLLLLIVCLGLICWRRRSRISKAEALTVNDFAAPSSRAGPIGAGAWAGKGRNGDYERVDTPTSSVHQRFDSGGHQNSNMTLNSQMDQYQMADFPSGSRNEASYYQSPSPMSPSSPYQDHQRQQYHQESSPLSHNQESSSNNFQRAPEAYYQEPSEDHQPGREDGYGGLIDDYARDQPQPQNHAR